MWDMIYAVWVVAINVAIVLNQIVLTRAIPTNSQVSSNKRSYVTYNTGGSKIQSVLVIVHSVRGVHTMSDSYTIETMKCRILKNKTVIWQYDLITNNYDQQLGPFFPNLNNGKQFWPGLNYSYQYPKGTRTYVAAVNSLKHTYLVSKCLISSGALLFVCDMIRSPNCLQGPSTDKGCAYVYTCSLPLITIDNEVMSRLFIVEHRRTFINIA